MNREGRNRDLKRPALSNSYDTTRLKALGDCPKISELKALETSFQVDTKERKPPTKPTFDELETALFSGCDNTISAYVRAQEIEPRALSRETYSKINYKKRELPVEVTTSPEDKIVIKIDMKNNLSPIEYKTWIYKVAGYSNVEIGQNLGIDRHTIADVLLSIRDKIRQLFT